MLFNRKISRFLPMAALAVGLATPIAPAQAQSILNTLTGDSPGVSSGAAAAAAAASGAGATASDLGIGSTGTGATSRGASPVDQQISAQQGLPRVMDLDGNAVDRQNPDARYDANGELILEPFGAELFRGQFLKQRADGVNPTYQIQPGDQVAVRIWGAMNFDAVLPVDAQGNIFIPEVGPVYVAGTANRNLNSRVRRAVASVFTSNVDIYTNLMGAQRLGVFVTGQVDKPGAYSGLPSDSILYFIDQAGGIKPEAGSYRDIRLLRNNNIVERFDLYDFLLEGTLPTPQLREGDVIFIGRREQVVEVRGAVRQPAAYEFRSDTLNGADLIHMVRPQATASNVALSGVRNGLLFNDYLTTGQLRDVTLRNGDKLTFEEDGATDTVYVSVTGQVVGQSNFAIRRDATLTELLNLVEIDPGVANLDAIYIKRKSVAEQQLAALQDSLMRLQRNAMTATSSTQNVAAIRRIEADLISRFVEQARTVEPEGRVVVTRNGTTEPILLEEGDEVIIPQKTQVVMVSGEVLIPQAVVHVPGDTVMDYVEQSGGFAQRAQRSGVVIVRANGETHVGNNHKVHPGDHILVLPQVDAKALQLTADITDILYKITIGTAAVLKIYD